MTKFEVRNSKFEIVELFIHLLVIILLVFLTSRPIAAQTMQYQGAKPATQGSVVVKESTNAAVEKEASEGASKKSEYQLPYAGLLPDHPLYVFKTIRDRITDFLITDSVKKAEFTLLAADKRLVSAAALVDKGKPELAESTASKGEKYLTRSLSLRDSAKSEGKSVDSLNTKLKNALMKHEEVLRELAEKTSGATKDSFTAMANELASKLKTF